jgi:AcrR family transcriptional regulator
MAKRGKYQLRARAERQRETRERIVAATLALHTEVGPAKTTVAEIARRANVQRLTVYNHFPRDAELFAACQARSFLEVPPPDPSAALTIQKPTERLRAVLTDVYTYFRRCEPLMGNVQRDRSQVPSLDALLRATLDAWAEMLASALSKPWSTGRLKHGRVRAMIAVALDYWTWRRMAGEGLADRQTADVMVAAVVAAAALRPVRSRRSGRPGHRSRAV